MRLSPDGLPLTKSQTQRAIGGIPATQRLAGNILAKRRKHWEGHGEGSALSPAFSYMACWPNSILIRNKNGGRAGLILIRRLKTFHAHQPDPVTYVTLHRHRA